MREELKNTCFFCKGGINSKQDRDLEHIIPNSLLRSLGIQNATLYGNHERTYSRVKVPAHRSCNNGFGNAYESRVLELLNDVDALYEDICLSEPSMPVIGGVNDSSAAIISAWLCKIYYGLFYNDYLRDTSLGNDSLQKQIIDDVNFDLIRKSYKDGNAFMLPSSLYAFKTENDDFDFRTSPYSGVIMFKYKTLVMVLCIGDGCLSKNYLSGEVLSRLKEHVPILEADHPSLAQNYLFAEISALRMCIPKAPSFSYNDKQIINMSSMTMVADPDSYYRVDDGMVADMRNEILAGLGFIMPSTID
ncbi:MAG: hypothetical protein ACI9TY_000638 [Alphaproteobacteria bacterium]|jgi:hypothetical protein